MFHTIPEAIEEIKKGNMVVVVDNEERENEGDLLMAAQMATPEAVNFMITHARGLLCAPMDENYIQKLGLRQMVDHNTDRNCTAFTVTVDHVSSTTGISAFERATTLQALADPTAAKADFISPGHIFPLQAVNGGVLKRNGHTEAAVDLARMAGLSPVGAICEIIKEDGAMARVPDLIPFAQNHGLKIITIEALQAYRLETEKHVRKTGQAELPTTMGNFQIIGYEDTLNQEEYVALVMGDPASAERPLVRIHSECMTGDVFHSLRCDCGEQLDLAMEKINQEGCGVILYAPQEGRGIGILNKIKAYEWQDKGLDTVEANLQMGFDADLRQYHTAAQILKDLGLHKIRFMTNNTEKISGLFTTGFDILREPLWTKENKVNQFYIHTKIEKMHHIQ